MNDNLTRGFTVVIDLDECRAHMERRRKIIEQVKERIRLAFGEDVDVSFVDAEAAEELSIGYRMHQLEALGELRDAIVEADHRQLVRPSIMKLERPAEPWREKRRKPWRKRR